MIFFGERKKEEQRVKKWGFISPHLLGGNFFTINIHIFYISFICYYWDLRDALTWPLKAYILAVNFGYGCHVMHFVILLIFGLFRLSYRVFMFHFRLDWFELCSSFTSHAFDFRLNSSWFQPPVQACWLKHETGFCSITCSFTLSPLSLLYFCCSLFVFFLVPASLESIKLCTSSCFVLVWISRNVSWGLYHVFISSLARWAKTKHQ